MGELRTIDADDLEGAIIATENEIAGEAWGQEDTDPMDESGDRSLESMGGGLEGQHEAGEDDDAEVSEESEGEDGETGEGEGEADGEAEQAAAGKDGEGDQSQQRQPSEQEPQGRVPSAKLREANERARAAEAERDRLKAQVEGQPKADPKLEALQAQVTTLTQLLQGQRAPQRTEPEPARQAEVPDIFENPKGFAEHLQKGFDTKLDTVLSRVRENSVSMSFELAHVRHEEAFPKAMAAINKLDPNNPQDRKLVQDIYNSPNPGEALVSWHRRSEALTRVGNDPDAYEKRIRTETRDALLKDPEFIKQVVASLRGDAQTGNNGSPRTESRLPPSLKRANGASTRGERVDPQAFDDSDQSVADAAWRT
jgi:hypothetical protein